MAKQVSELEGVELDYWVAKANESHLGGARFSGVGGKVTVGGDFCIPYQPSTNWAQGGPIIEREKIMTGIRESSDIGIDWSARKFGLDDKYYGPTALIAAMRAFVVSKFGESVDGL